MIKKVNKVYQQYNITTSRLRLFNQTVTWYFLGFKVYQYIEKHSEHAVKEEANNIGFQSNK